MPSVIAGGGSAVFPSALECVNRVFNECLRESVNSLTPATIRINLVLEALNDAQLEIWDRNKWDWQRRDAAIPWVADQFDYVLPNDFDRLAGPVMIGTNTPLQEWDLVSWRNEYGSYQVGSAVPSSTPTDMVIQGTNLRVYPPPSQDWIDSYPQGNIAYWRVIPPRLSIADEADSFDVPIVFLEAMICFAKARLLTTDGGDESAIRRHEARFEAILTREIRRTNRGSGNLRVRLPGPSRQGMNTE